MKLSIITPCLNRAGFIPEAVESVLCQDHPEVEPIVMDGGSTDGTLEVLARYPQL
jgi:glycosyltransferase involved in cell wall biosynthesis